MKVLRKGTNSYQPDKDWDVKDRTGTGVKAVTLYCMLPSC